jgi:hypothetical protein
LWGLWVALFGLHVLDEGSQLLSVNLLPSGSFPRLKLVVDQGNEIQHLFQIVEFILAVLELLMVRFLQNKQSFQVVKLLGLLLKLASFVIVIVDGDVSLVDDFVCSVLNILWAVLKEFTSEVVHLLHEGSLTLLDVLRLSVLKRKNFFLNWTQSGLANIVKLGLALLESDKDLVTWEDNSVFFQENDTLFHWLELSEGSVLDDSDVS